MSYLIKISPTDCKTLFHKETKGKTEEPAEEKESEIEKNRKI